MWVYMWKFGRKKPPTVSMDWPPEADSIPINDTPHEAVINKVLDEAAEKAKNFISGESFKIEIDPTEIPPGVYYMEIVGPIMMRSMTRGLNPGTCYNWTFEFSKM